MGKNLETMKAFLAHFQSGDWQGACAKYVAPDFECHEPPGLPQEGIFKGPEASIEISKIYRGIWDIEIGKQEYWEAEADPIVFSRYEITWVSKATGQSMTQPVVEINTFEDGMLKKMEVFHFNPIGLMATLGR